VVLVLEGSEQNVEQAFALIKAIKGEPPVSSPQVGTPAAASLNYSPQALQDAIKR
jgi:hypothetical protein